MTFDELFAQVRREVGPGDDNVEALLMMAEAGLRVYFSPDAAWRSEPVRRNHGAIVYTEVIVSLRQGLTQAGHLTGDALRDQATAVAESFRTILNRVLRVHLERRPVISS